MPADGEPGFHPYSKGYGHFQVQPRDALDAVNGSVPQDKIQAVIPFHVILGIPGFHNVNANGEVCFHICPEFVIVFPEPFGIIDEFHHQSGRPRNVNSHRAKGAVNIHRAQPHGRAGHPVPEPDFRAEIVGFVQV